MFVHIRVLAVVSCFAGLSIFSAATRAADSPAALNETPIAAPTPVTAAQIAGWVTDLSSDSFRTRRLAMRNLIKTGSQAVAPIAAAADTDNLELASRCLSILKVLHQSENAKAKAVAEDALKKLAKSEHASVAQRAADAVKKPEPPRRNIARGGIRIQFRAVPGGGIQIARPQRALQREIKVEENGKKIEIKETLGREIVVKVTEKVEGKEKTTEYKVQNADQLKQKHPAIYKLYDKHMRAAGAPKFKPVAVPRRVVRGKNVSISQTNNNGNRETKVKMDGKEIQINDTQGKNIIVKVTDKVGGNAKTTEYKAKDLDELKKKHPEAAKLYQQYVTGQNNAFGRIFQGRIQINGGVPQVLPIQIPQIQIQNIQIPGGNPAAKKQIDAAQARLKQASQQLKKFAERGNVTPEELAKIAKEIESAIQQLKAAQKQLSR